MSTFHTTARQGAIGHETDACDEQDSSDNDAGIEPTAVSNGGGGASSAKGSAAAGRGNAAGKRPMEQEDALDLSGAEKLSSVGGGASKKMRAAQQAAAGGSWRSQNGEGGVRGNTRSALNAASDALSTIAERPATGGNNDMLGFMMMEMRRAEERREDRMAGEEQERVRARAAEMRMQMTMIAALFRPSPTTAQTPIDFTTPPLSTPPQAGSSARNREDQTASIVAALFDTADSSPASLPASAARRSPRNKKD